MESAYEAMLHHALTKAGLHVVRQQPVQLRYDGITLEESFRVDLLVEHQLIVEIKSAVRTEAVFTRQLLTYLRLMDLRIGILLNFGAPTLKEGLHRVINSRASC